MWLFDGYEPGQFQTLTIPSQSDVANFSYPDPIKSARGDIGPGSNWADSYPWAKALAEHAADKDYLPDQEQMTSHHWFFEADEDVSSGFSTLSNEGELIVVTGTRSSGGTTVWYVYFGEPNDDPVPSSDATIEPDEGDAPAARYN